MSILSNLQSSCLTGLLYAKEDAIFFVKLIQDNNAFHKISVLTN